METFESRLTTQILKNQQELIGLLLAARSEREERLRTGSLEDSTPSQKSKPVRSNPRRPNRASTPRRSDEELLRLRKRLQDEITREPGQSLRRYSETLGVSVKDLDVVRERLLKEGDIRKVGQRSSTVYYPSRIVS